MEATGKQSQNYEFLNKVSKSLVMVSVCSIILSFSFLEHNFVFSVYTILQRSTYTVGKNCMFLVCNGILVFIVKNSGLIQNPQLEKADSSCEISVEGGVRQVQVVSNSRAFVAEEVKQVKVLAEIRASAAEEKIVVEVDEAEEMENGCSGKEVETVFLIGGEEEEEEEEEEKENLVEDEEEDEETGSISREELNKKCEDFIRKMRKELSFKLRH